MLFTLGMISHLFGITQIVNGFLPTSPVGLGLYFSALVIVLFLCHLIALCTERHTDEVRALLKRRLRPLLA